MSELMKLSLPDYNGAGSGPFTPDADAGLIEAQQQASTSARIADLEEALRTMTLEASSLAARNESLVARAQLLGEVHGSDNSDGVAPLAAGEPRVDRVRIAFLQWRYHTLQASSVSQLAYARSTQRDLDALLGSRVACHECGAEADVGSLVRGDLSTRYDDGHGGGVEGLRRQGRVLSPVVEEDSETVANNDGGESPGVAAQVALAEEADSQRRSPGPSSSPGAQEGERRWRGAAMRALRLFASVRRRTQLQQAWRDGLR